MSFAFHLSRGDEQVLAVPAIGLDLKLRLAPEVSDGALTVIETTNAPGFGPPLHRHKETEVFRVLERCYLFEVDGRRFQAASGDVVSVPGGAAHTFRNIGHAPARPFVLILPALDALSFFAGLGSVMHGGQADPAALAAFGTQWGVEFLGPPLADPG